MELPDLAGRAELVRRYAHLLHHFGNELGERPLVRHDAQFFPDRFDKDAPSLERLVRRLQAHAGLLDVPIDVRLVTLEGGVVSSSSCGSGSCSPSCATPGASASSVPRLVEDGSGWTLNVFDGELHHPVALTTQLSLALAEVFLAETSTENSPVEAPREASRDLAAVGLGLGLLLLEGSFIYAKSCGGPSVTQLTHLSVGELAIACSLFIAYGRQGGRKALAGLSTTQQALLSEANDWAASNAALVQRLRSDPGQLALTAPPVRDTRSWLLRVFDRSSRRGSATAEPSLEQALAAGLGEGELLELARDVGARTARRASARGPLSAVEPNADAARRAREREELSALVDEALRGS